MKRGRGRPRTVNPATGKVRRLTITLAEPVARDIEREARKTGKSLADVVRERLKGAA